MANSYSIFPKSIGYIFDSIKLCECVSYEILVKILVKFNLSAVNLLNYIVRIKYPNDPLGMTLRWELVTLRVLVNKLLRINYSYDYAYT